jgi:hypothetical protein
MFTDSELHHDETLSEEFVLSEQEILAEFKEQCAAAVDRRTVELPAELQEVAKAHCRMKCGIP